MYSDKEASVLKQKFWTRFGQYMAPVPSASGEKVNWINYKTGVRGIRFKAEADDELVYVAAEIVVQDTVLQHHYFDLFHKFAQWRGFLTDSEWKFKKDSPAHTGNSISIICAELQGVNIFREEDWPAMISFIKKHLIVLDDFWNEFKPAFE